MPLPLPYFKNEADPFLPKDIIPVLYYYDEYQTYDLIVIQGLPTIIGAFFEELFKKVPVPLGNFLIERFVPFKYSWCNSYSEKWFNFIKQYAGLKYSYESKAATGRGISEYAEDPSHYVNGVPVVHYPVLTEEFGNEFKNYVADFPDIQVSHKVVLDIPATEEPEDVVITFLLHDSRSPQEFTRRYCRFSTARTSINASLIFAPQSLLDFPTDIIRLVNFSIVVSSSNAFIANAIEAQLENLSKGYLHKNFDFFLNQLTSLIAEEAPRLKLVLKEYDVLSEYHLKGEAGNYAYKSIEQYLEKTIIPHFRLIDSNFYFANLTFANNNVWNDSEAPTTYLGKPVVYAGDKFYVWFKPQFSVEKKWFWYFADNDAPNFLLKRWSNPYLHRTNLVSSYSEVHAHAEIIHLSPLIFHAVSCLSDSNYAYYTQSLVHAKDEHSDNPFDVEVKTSKFILAETAFVSIRAITEENKSTCFLSLQQLYPPPLGARPVKPFYNSYPPVKKLPVDLVLSHSTTVKGAYNDSQLEGITWENDGGSALVKVRDYFLYLQDSVTDEFVLNMPDSIRVKEIHAALQAATFAQDPQSPNLTRVANIGYYVERIARVLGISVNPDGSILGIRQKRTIEPGEPIPAGWNFGQWGLNNGGQPETGGQQGGNASEFRDGIVYEQRSNRAFLDEFNPGAGVAELKRGAYVLCENIPQLMDEFWDDLDKGLGWQDLGASAIPNADGSGKYCTYEGAAKLLTEIAYDVSRISQHTAQTQICVMICQALANELLRSTGQPLAVKSFDIGIGGGTPAAVPYRGLAEDAMSGVEQWASLMQMIAPVLAANLKITTDKTGTPIV